MKNRYRFDSPGSYEKIVSIHQINEEALFDSSHSTSTEQNAARDHEGQENIRGPGRLPGNLRPGKPDELLPG